jgi:hypothetical protein
VQRCVSKDGAGLFATVSKYRTATHDRHRDRMSNMTLQAVTIAILFAHGAALLWAVLRRTMRPIVWLNLCVATAVLLYWAPQIARVIGNGDVQVMALSGFALATVAMSIAALRGLRIPAWLIFVPFALQTAASVAAVIFAFTFRITRLF